MVLAPALALLAGIQRHGSVRAAADRCGLSYRHAWGKLRTLEQRLGVPLAVLERGRGARLSEAGRILLRAVDVTDKQLSSALAEAGADISRGLASLTSAVPDGPYRIAASHSFGIVYLRDTIDRAQPDLIDLHHYGSLEALQRYANGECDGAGFHIPLTRAGKRIAGRFLQLLNADHDRLLLLEHRVQGLLSRTDQACTALTQLADQPLRFVNRQPGSGTRLLFDALLEEYGIDPHDIDGYEHEEHTHLAIASLIAGKIADVGVGVRTAAERFGLSFTPLATEVYVLAMKQAALRERLGQAFQTAVDSAEYLRRFPAEARIDLPIGAVLRVSELRDALPSAS